MDNTENNFFDKYPNGSVFIYEDEVFMLSQGPDGRIAQEPNGSWYFIGGTSFSGVNDNNVKFVFIPKGKIDQYGNK